MNGVLDGATIVGVLGAGTMGGGIAQVAARAGHRVIVTDTRAEALAQSREAIGASLARQVEKGKLEPGTAQAVSGRLAFVPADAELRALAAAGLVIEAIVEDLEAKRGAFRRLDAVLAPDAVLATNTSSLSVTAIAAACRRPARVIGLHFFNPAPVLPLVEVVPGLATDPALTAAARGLVARWGKTTVVASDTPGFIVNRIARPFYGEGLRIYEEGLADRPTIDWALREIGGFRMGPFELMDLIGNDVNYAVSRSLFEAFGFDARYRPFLTQKLLVDAGRLGRKTGRGHYEYQGGATPPEPTRDQALGSTIASRVLALLINAAADALFWRVATREDIDLAMTAGVNYPKGLLRWADEIGPAVVLDRLDRLHADYGEERYRASPLLRKTARDRGRFYS
jgi:3-hydroxybutyryl-CoA dehydrogenase